MITIRKAAESYLRGLRVKNLANRSVKLYRATLEDLADRLEQRDVHMANVVTKKHLEDWALDLHRQGISAGVRRSRIRLVKRFFKWIKAGGEILSDPASDLDVPKVPNPLPEAPPTEAELDRLLEIMPSVTPIDLRDRALVEVLYGCMLRISEAMSLDVVDVDLDEHRVMVRSGKGGKSRVVPLPVRGGDAVEAYLAVRENLVGGHVQDMANRKALFIGRAGKRLTDITVRERLRDIGKMVGLEGLHPHALRHAGAVHTLRGGASVRHVQELLGHARLDTSMGYMRLVPSDLKEAYDAAFPTLRV